MDFKTYEFLMSLQEEGIGLETRVWDEYYWEVLQQMYAIFIGWA
jgi:hypothetical protein